MASLNAGKRVEEQMRRVSSRVTMHIAKHVGVHLGMYVGCGYPKSGTVWLCHLVSYYLGIPHPQNYALPIGMSAVLHGHWLHDDRFPSCAYIRRDGRDVMVSLYFYNMQVIAEARHPRQVSRLQHRYRALFGPNFDPGDIKNNLPRFIEAEMTDPIAYRGVTWQQHLQSWCGRDHANVTVTSFEEMRADPITSLSLLIEGLTDSEADGERVRMAVERADFNRSGRTAGTEDRTSFMRKGVTGDWRNHFTRQAGEVFDQFAGPTLLEYDYESDSDWYRRL